MKHKNNEGSSLIEVLIAMAILAVIVIPVCSSLILSHRLNARTEEVLQAQLDVASAVEYYMATGIPDDTEVTEEDGDYSLEKTEVQLDNDAEKEDRFPAVIVRIDEVVMSSYVENNESENNEELCYKVIFLSESGKYVTNAEGDKVFRPDVTVTTVIRAVSKTEVTNDEET